MFNDPVLQTFINPPQKKPGDQKVELVWTHKSPNIKVSITMINSEAGVAYKVKLERTRKLESGSEQIIEEISKFDDPSHLKAFLEKIETEEGM